MAASSRSIPIYWEKQESALCGTHCLNNLLQGPYFSEIDMAQIAHALDDKERTLMAEGEGTDSSSYLAYMAADSSNVDESGNFSVEVLATCLRNFNLELVNLASPDCVSIRENLLAQTGFICNLQSHWLALRKLGGKWWNLNSLQADNDGWGPTFVGDAYLDTLIMTLRERKFSIFIVSGDSFPPVDIDADVSGRGKWFDSAEVIEHGRGGNKKQKVSHSMQAQIAQLMKPGGAAAGDRQLAEAMAASMQTHESGGSSTVSAALRQSMDAPRSPMNGGGGGRGSGAGGYDADLERAIAMSMSDAPAKPAAAAAAAHKPSAPAPAAAAAAAAAAPTMTPREAAAAAAIARVAAANAASAAAAGGSAAPARPVASIAAEAAAPSSSSSAAAAAVPEAAAAPAASPLSPVSEPEDDEEAMRRAIEMSMQQPATE